MRIVTSPNAMQLLARRWKGQGIRIGFVPTMGYLHEGHISLVRRARKLVGPKGRVIVSIYVNPTQFAPTEDLANYPRDFKKDRRMCREAGVDAIFYPTDADMYPGRADGLYSTYVVEETLSQSMEGTSRPTHFRGVTTIVAKLFNLVLPDVAVFGAKDFQQAAVVKRMVGDLNFPVKVVVAPTHREPDGLAMSSRNKYLSPEERAQAVVLWRCLQTAREAVGISPISAAKLKSRLAKLIATQSAARLDYLEFFDPESLEVVETVSDGTQMALAVFVGKTRLIDNARIVKFDIYDGNKEVRFALGKAGSNPLFVIGINPSSANENRSDPTIDRVEKLTKAWGFDGFVMLNLYPIRTPEPKKLPNENGFDEILAGRNVDAILEQLESVSRCQIWAAWGDSFELRPYLKRCLMRIVKKSAGLNIDWQRYGSLTIAGNPKHPLAWPRLEVTENSKPTLFDVKKYLNNKL